MVTYIAQTKAVRKIYIYNDASASKLPEEKQIKENGRGWGMLSTGRCIVYNRLSLVCCAGTRICLGGDPTLNGVKLPYNTNAT